MDKMIPMPISIVSTATALCVLSFWLAIYLVRVYIRLYQIPGPVVAAFSNIPRMYWVWTKNAHEKHIALHKLYGNLVRIGPDLVSVGDPAEISHIYGFDDTFSKPYGFVEKGKDIEGIMGDIWSHFERVSLIGQMPWIDTFLRINPLLSKLRPQPVSPIAKFSMARIQERKIRGEQGTSEVNDRDLLSRFLEAQAQNPGTPPFSLFSWIAGNITAGSDTTATILRSFFYYLLKNPATLQTLMSEITAARRAGRLSNPPTWKETQDLRYLNACVMEAQRIHAPIGLHLERVVPKEGATLCGKYIKAGTVVGIDAWVVHRDPGTFGDDADKWRPERWIDCTEEQRARMDRAIFTFGAGSRVCVGKNFSLLIIYKLLPTLLQRFEISLADPHATWTVENRWFVVQRDLLVNLKRSAV
ncbi:hypothetical protein NHQ30_006045 [Ciborinia camelliae]|nr:hypothetical protein NHQ30_006045 [Ciborinia camelliae]